MGETQADRRDQTPVAVLCRSVCQVLLDAGFAMSGAQRRHAMARPLPAAGFVVETAAETAPAVLVYKGGGSLTRQALQAADLGVTPRLVSPVQQDVLHDYQTALQEAGLRVRLVINDPLHAGVPYLLCRQE